MAIQQPKKPVGGGYGQFLSEKRPEFLKSCAGKRASAVSAMAGKAWKELSDAEKAPYTQKYEIAKAKYEKDMADFLVAGGEKTKGTRALRSEKRGLKADKKMKDPKKPKKPAGGAYGVFLAENRVRIVASLPKDHKITDVSKAAGTEWKALSDAEKKPYEETYRSKMEEYKKAMDGYTPPDIEDNTEGQQKPLKQSQKAKDPNKPKKPAGGAYGVFLAENRARIVASLPKVHKITDVTKAAGKEWKALSKADRKPYEEKLETKKEEYKKAMEGYVPPAGEEHVEKTPTRQQKKKAAVEKPPKRARPDTASSSTPAKRGRAKKLDITPPKEAEIDASVWKEVESLSMVSQFKKLAARPDVKASGKSHKDMLDALKSSEGLVNKAKSLLITGA